MPKMTDTASESQPLLVNAGASDDDAERGGGGDGSHGGNRLGTM